MINNYFRYKIIITILILTIGLLNISESASFNSNNSKSKLAEAKIEVENDWLKQQIRLFRTYSHLDRVYRLIDENRLPEAKKELEKYLKLESGNVNAHMTGIIVFYRLKEYNEAIKHANIILEENHNLVTALIYRGLSYNNLGQLDKAFDDFLAITRKSNLKKDDHIFSLNMVADLAINLQQYNTALTVLQELSHLGANFQLYFRQGVLFEKLNKMNEAEIAYQQALGLADSPKQRLSVMSVLGMIYQKKKAWKEAEEMYKAALKIDPNHLELIHASADLAYIKKDHPSVIKYMRQALKLKPNAKDREMLANVLYSQKKYKAALKEYTKLITEMSVKQDICRIYMARGHTYVNLKNYSQAADDFGEAAKISNKTDVLLFQAQALEQAERLDEAIKVLEISLKKYHTASLYYQLAMLYLKKGDNKKTLQHLNEATKNNPDIKLKLMVYKQQGFINYKEGCYLDAREVMKQALLLDNKDADIYTSLGEISIKLNAYTEAINYFKKSLTINDSIVGWRNLVEAYKMKEDWQKVIDINTELLQHKEISSSIRCELLNEQGIAYSQLGDYPKTSSEFRKAIANGCDYWQNRLELGISLYKMGRWTQALREFRILLNQQDTPNLHLYIGRCYEQLNQSKMAINSLSQAQMKIEQLSKADQGDLNCELGYLYSLTGEYDKAIKVWETSLKFQESPGVMVKLGQMQRLKGNTEQALQILYNVNEEELALAMRVLRFDEMAYNYATQKKIEEAINVLSKANNLNPSAERHYRLAQYYREIDLLDSTVYHLNMAISMGQMTKSEECNLHCELGYLYSSKGEYDNAIKSWEAFLVFQYNPDVMVNLGRMQRLIGNKEQALETLCNINEEELALAMRVLRFDEIAYNYAAQKKFEEAINVLLKANTLEPSAERFYQLGLYYQEIDHLDSAISNFKAAVSKDDHNKIYLETLAYAYYKQKNYEESSRLFEIILTQYPTSLSIYQDIGYLNIQDMNNEEAVKWFKLMIDKQDIFPVQTASEKKELDEGIHQAKKEISKLTKNLDIIFYQTYRSHEKKIDADSPELGIGRILSSQGGIGIAYRPPVIGYRDEQVFQLVSRLLWDTKPHSLKMKTESLQGTIGFQYKPFRLNNFFVGAEKLFKVGSQSTDNWLLRGLYSWSNGIDLEKEKSSWNYTTLYGDIGYYTDKPSTTIFYGEARQGVSFKYKCPLIFTPHLVIDGLWQDPDPVDGSYLEGGAGISLKYLFNETCYKTYQFSTELLLQYKTQFDESFSGWVITGIIQF
ncbi:MAG: tetratricopeptide repeat protein [bacterium]